MDEHLTEYLKVLADDWLTRLYVQYLEVVVDRDANHFINKVGSNILSGNI